MHLKQRLIIASDLFAAAQAQAAIINFDELDCDYSNARTDYTFAAGYGGLVWNNIECANDTMQDPFGSGLYLGSGYIDGAQTPRNLAIVPFTPPATQNDGLTGSITGSGGRRFDLHSLYITPVWFNNLKVKITATRAGAVVHTQTVTLAAGSPTFLNLNYSDVDKVEFASQAGSGSPHTAYFSGPFGMNFVGRIFALDTITITLRPLPQQPAAVPAASTGALAALSGALGLAGALAARRRRNVTRQKQEQIHEG